MTDSHGRQAIQQLVLKVHSRCDLACDHCYVYEHADQSWRGRPVVITEEVLGQVSRRLAAYATDTELESVTVILHGGEPLLAGPARLRRICAELTRVLTPVTSLDLRVHTNGVQLGRRHLEVFREFGVKIGISLDGDRASNDRHRLDRRGRSSHERVLRAVGLLRLPEYRHLYQGLLCTVDVANDPIAVHDALTALEPPRIDYLLPHSTWDSPPPGHGDGTPYADWLLKVFDRWEEQGRPMPVRTFASVLSTLRGGPSLTEALGLAPSDLAVVETDGSFEQADSLKTAYDGAPATGYDVFRHGFEEFSHHPGVRARRLGVDGLSETCRGCPVVRSCGGGLYAHRYSGEREFDNPSVFCADLRALVEGIAERITERALVPSVTDIGELRLAQTHLNRVLVTDAHRHLSGHPAWDDAWELLLRLDAGERSSAALDGILSHPYLRPSLLGPADAPGRLPRLMATAVAAAVRAGARAALGWDQPDTEVYLPTLGTVRLPFAGRVEFLVADGAFHWRLLDHGGPQPSKEWRPLREPRPGAGPPLLIDDADPYRDCYSAQVAAPLGPSDLALFAKRLGTAHDLAVERHPGLHDSTNLLLPTTVTPLRAGSGLRLGTRAPDALGLAVDFEPEEFVRELPLLARRSRITALRQVADLHVPGSGAGRLLDRASASLGRAATAQDRFTVTEELRRARRALERLDAHLADELTENGTYLVQELQEEWVTLHG
ncbi:radical SAM/SPASM protein FxsBH, inactivated beta-hydroxylase extension form [Streptomyces scabiei]|uniref:radical SAM/SPASM protein FxsBH, inactivated beta-hydroxylase extension form n=1 Tax=Streptomyces scabiei TaxID=1930 RepID=UPI0029B8D22F|nr:radical SAM/SPASM protein FxsB, inactivated metallohydrolase extension form [Streptomyces scabiei]MDX3517386.1 radical SAM/SPASM protein FxsB, inactivated metallohydrolase extension form [Streptomyces scabiei]